MSYYETIRKRYENLGVDVDAAIEKAIEIPISMHCWQADDVVGFETKPAGLDGGGIMATGNHPGRARTGDEARADYEKAMEYIPGTLRLNLHASYAETGGEIVDRDQLEPKHFETWMKWSEEKNISIDFNPTNFSHPLAEDGFTASNRSKEIRDFWIRHIIASRKIAQAFAENQGNPCVVNHWFPDGSKDMPADRWIYRKNLMDSLDKAIVNETTVDKNLCKDFVESKVFGIGSEEYVVGSGDFYSFYAVSRGIGMCMDMGHYHPTETVNDKISSNLIFSKELLLHLSRPIRWDSDHVAILNDDLQNVFLEIARGDAWDRVHLATDFFDASINRVAAYIIGVRAVRKAILFALLDPSTKLKDYENRGQNGFRLALMEEMKTVGFSVVWEKLCEKAGVVVGTEWIDEIEQYENDILLKRN